MSWVTISAFVYSTLVLLGGVFGYFKAGSPMSLYTSVVAAIVIDIGALVSLRNATVGFSVVGVAAAALAGFFLYRIVAAKSYMPGVPALVLSLAMLAILLVGHLQRNGQGS
jgi:uncharacterized membrane protein (UPF0136 family)